MKISMPKEMPVYLEKLDNKDAIETFTKIQPEEDLEIENMHQYEKDHQL